MVVSRILLSGSTSGRPIKIGATSSPGTTVHTAVAGSVAFDEIYLYLSNTDTVTRQVTVQFGGTTDPDDSIVKTYSIPANSAPLRVVDGHSLNGGLVVKVFADTTNVILASGWVNRIQ